MKGLLCQVLNVTMRISNNRLLISIKLDEYERLLFGEDDAETVEPEAAEEAPAEDAAE